MAGVGEQRPCSEPALGLTGGWLSRALPHPVGPLALQAPSPPHTDPHGLLSSSRRPPAPRDTPPAPRRSPSVGPPIPPSAGLPAGLGPVSSWSTGHVAPALDPSLWPARTCSDGACTFRKAPLSKRGVPWLPRRGWSPRGWPPPWPQWGWHFLPPPLPSPTAWQRPEGSWWGFPSFLARVLGWWGGVLMGIWRGPGQFRNFGRGMSPPSPRGSLGPSCSAGPEGGCSFCLPMAMTGNSPPQEAACALSATVRMFFILTSLNRTFCSHIVGHRGYCALALGAEPSTAFQPCSMASVSGLQVWRVSSVA